MRTVKEIEKIYSDKNLLKRINAISNWWHTIRISSNVQTPGIYDQKMWKNILSIIPKDLTDKTVLDIGTADGGFSFECEKRNAKKITSIDKFTVVGSTQFHHIDSRIKLLMEIFDSKIILKKMDVDDLEKLNEKFDLILFLGVYYHLTNPLLAMQNLFKVSKELVIFEGEILETNRNIGYVLEEGEPGGKFLFSPSFIDRYAKMVGFTRVEFLGYFQNGKEILSDMKNKDESPTLKRNRGIFYFWK